MMDLKKRFVLFLLSLLFLTSQVSAQSITGALGLDGFKIGALGTLGTTLLWILIVLFLFGIIGGGIILWIWNKSYNQIVELEAKINGVQQLVARYKAKWIRLPGTTKRLLYIRGANRWESPQYLTGKNVWKFHRRSVDGQWHNFKYGDVDEKLDEMQIEVVQGDVRMQSAANEKILRDRLQKKKDWLGIITQIAYVITFILIFIALVVLFSRLTEVAEAQTATAGAMTKMAEAIQNFYENKIEGQSPQDIDRGDTGVLTPVEPVAISLSLVRGGMLWLS
jgi:hypothetical protein